jgi:hypothetical protein
MRGWARVEGLEAFLYQLVNGGLRGANRAKFELGWLPVANSLCCIFEILMQKSATLGNGHTRH